MNKYSGINKPTVNKSENNKKITEKPSKKEKNYFLYAWLFVLLLTMIATFWTVKLSDCELFEVIATLIRLMIA